MKVKLLATIATLATSVFLSPFALSPTTQAKNIGTNFVCENWQGVPTTFAKTADQAMIPVLLWQSDYFSYSGYDANTRCQLVSNRFQYFYNTGQLNYITTGRMNRMPVVCVSSQNGGGCNGLLFTLKPGVNPGQTLQKLMAVRVRSTGPLNETTKRVYIDFEDYLNQVKTSNRDKLVGDR
ncbi:MAG: COP23 domain-containing protein [Crocosphaera sp.]